MPMSLNKGSAAFLYRSVQPASSSDPSCYKFTKSLSSKYLARLFSFVLLLLSCFFCPSCRVAPATTVTLCHHPLAITPLPSPIVFLVDTRLFFVALQDFF